MAIRVALFTRQFEDAFRKAALNGLREAAYELHGIAQDRLNTLYPPASKRNESPRRRSGDGRRSVFAQAEMVNGKPAAITGTTSERLVEQGRDDFNYMAHHELNGRPWLLPALQENLPRIAAAFDRGAGEL
jgi:hypothetical protein